jgi:polysaccharide deacetylase family protein (PEP-CTERM system associated)
VTHSVVNALTFDVEDWFHGLEPRAVARHGLERRLGVGMQTVLDLLAEVGTRATFFVLGCVAHEQPDLVRRIVDGGHEVGVHGWDHIPIFEQTPAQFRTELVRSIDVLEDITRRRVLAYRAPFFSIRRDTLWALDELARAGVRYDSSILPVHHYRCGIPGARRDPHPLQGGELLEFPISTLRLGRLNLAFSGGFYVRALPYPILRWAFRQLNARGQPAVAYFHPWELDLGHPRRKCSSSWVIHGSHSYGLPTAQPKMRALLRDFAWAPLGAALHAHGLPLRR